MKRLAILSFLSFLGLSTQALAGGGSGGYIFNARAGSFACVNADGSKESALKDTITQNGAEIKLYYLKYDVIDPVSYFIIGHQGSGLRNVSVGVPVTVKGGFTRLAGEPEETFNSFQVGDEASKIATADAQELFAEAMESTWLDSDHILLTIHAENSGLCRDSSAKVQVVLTFD